MTTDERAESDEPTGSDGEPADSDGPLRRAGGLAKKAAGATVGFVTDKRFGRTPAGRARSAARDGATTFHIRLDLDDITYRSGAKGNKTDAPEVGDAIGQIEAEGWRLDHIEYLTETDEWERTDNEGNVTRGTTQRSSAVLLFRSVTG